MKIAIRTRFTILTLGLLVLVATGPGTAANARGILDKQAPDWGVEEWINVDSSAPRPEVTDYRGKVLYLYFFQSWCPGCHRHGFPTLKQMMQRYENDPNVAFVAIQTTFEGFSSNTFARARVMAQQYDLNIPVGHSGNNGTRSPLLGSYHSGGTPWTIIVDPSGTVRYNDFHIDTATASSLIETHKTQTSVVPPSRTGGHLIEKPLSLDGLDWAASDYALLDNHVTLLRFWVHSCPYCIASLPAIELLREEFADQSFQTVAVYHAKPPRPFAAVKAARIGNEMGYHGLIAVDPNWKLLNKYYLDIETEAYTSISVLMDRDGLVRYVHPGPEIRPAEMGGGEEVAADFQALRAAIRALLAE